MTPKEKTSTYFYFQNTTEPRCRPATGAVPPGHLGALGEGRRRGVGSLSLSDSALALLSVALQDTRGPDRLS